MSEHRKSETLTTVSEPIFINSIKMMNGFHYEIPTRWAMYVAIFQCYGHSIVSFTFNIYFINSKYNTKINLSENCGLLL